MKKTFNGHESYNSYNISLWINNGEGLYAIAKEDIRLTKNREEAAKRMLESLIEFGITHIPDGSRYTKTGIRNAMRDIG